MKFWVIGVEASEDGFLKNFYSGPFDTTKAAIASIMPRDMETKWCVASADDDVTFLDIQRYPQTHALVPANVRTKEMLQVLIVPFENVRSSEIPHLKRL